MYGQQAPLLAPQPSLSAALASTESRPCPCCPTSPFIYNRFIGGYTITLVLQWLSLIFLVAGTATPALFFVSNSQASITYGLFHACVVSPFISRYCESYQQNGGAALGSDHLGKQWSAFQALDVVLCVATFAMGALYTLRMVVVQRGKMLSRRAEISMFLTNSAVLFLAGISLSLFLACYGNVKLPPGATTKALGSSFTLILTAHIMQVAACVCQIYTFLQHVKSIHRASPATVTPSRAAGPEPVPMAAMASPAAAQYYPAYQPAAAAAYQQPAFYGQAYHVPQQYAPPQQQHAGGGGGMPSYYAPPQYYAPAQAQPQGGGYAHAQQPYPAEAVVHYGVAPPQQGAGVTPQ